MAGKIDELLVRRVAQLARLELSDQEIVQFSMQLSAIVNYIEKLNELNTDEVEPLAHCLPICNVFRSDEVLPSLTQERALANAPDAENGYFKVPKVLENGGGA
ncbi:MAG TPA: Asp-tRNA(Asn)/Glu-tRNA(Gln) amidotransferase subunit GatC [Anaerohalosphaeraceae bacterium]|jgi:aspartyl-tRNA(Asn)/glutamyl-tRNA(Gln) amidotransferase subunit C|nr:Asp-tRNA(Asn)/Glu-tRNA(Gln) amidotransferase subunit GatC [Anaerohalosphaeraceae bacterium]HOT71952.1 Asp-tRNA(Asn)/Glu-tRNA(Gln) amidotransferase subunit GatC [Anaerohalosphaeraceae bacterium]HPB91952.1 Asp-tRNA(Asn)/Glu-tRNA(Gln) amidotransferase subunit GatC [Anaerohalosphaeraceae bacterium]HQG05246.1 Asp-tRNA(Asn)/Glu-tRNA(Gln) amidotransferase subunit GatC [Anaerohalosphaeraceae bacterium]HQI06964.1 Asp-tRNA(Asn)/Glu-tRNA(Gln) amidotransferase subunit GatC [Anaerohalosphaeraceae bacteri